MTKRFNKYFPVGDKVVIAHLDESPGEGGYISIVHAVEPKDMPGEVQIGAYEVPDLVKALTEAALYLTMAVSMATADIAQEAVMGLADVKFNR